MKKIIIPIFAIFIVVYWGCSQEITFDTPQPVQQEPLQSFPKKLQGSYVAFDQASVLHIGARNVIRQYDFEYIQHADSASDEWEVIFDTVYINKMTGENEIVRVYGDTIVRHAEWKDTLFDINNGDVLKKFKGYYFLNMQSGENKWMVKKLALLKNEIVISRLQTEKDLELLKEITEQTEDSVVTHFTLSRKQFKRFIQQKGFAENEVFKKVTIVQ
jgi:hypothetical protein